MLAGTQLIYSWPKYSRADNDDGQPAASYVEYSLMILRGTLSGCLNE